MASEFTAKYVIYHVAGRFQLHFFCDLCGCSYSSSPIRSDSSDTARAVAIAEARRHFNRCHKCNRWVCGQCYNEDEMECVECSPHNDIDKRVLASRH